MVIVKNSYMISLHILTTVYISIWVFLDDTFKGGSGNVDYVLVGNVNIL